MEPCDNSKREAATNSIRQAESRIIHLAIQGPWTYPNAGDEVKQMQFDGVTFESEHDEERLATQYERVFHLMKDGNWRTLSEIASCIGGTTPGVSARLRDMRKERFGAHTVNRRARGDRSTGLFEYQMIQTIRRSLENAVQAELFDAARAI